MTKEEKPKSSQNNKVQKITPNQSSTDKVGQDQDYESNLKETEKLLNEYNFKLQDKEKPKRLDVLLLPSVKKEFQDTAKKLNMPLSEYLRRSAFAAQSDPSILTRSDVDAAEQNYKAALGASRWTRENE
ncbi:hypothetical protein [uncultured Roseibium sp.]|uniref:hypothetical protein n=1 Tax=uncultured Roseibium sp. TaxID=1936171 RepID=UPI002612685D|nr:hypothetical protein [uncultured Roseibium sp.]